MTEPEKAWLAAMIDGEGCIYRRPDGRYEVAITSNDVCLLDEAVRITGLGLINRSTKPQPGWRQTYRWRVAAKADVGAVLSSALPYLILKRAKAASALEWVNA